MKHIKLLFSVLALVAMTLFATQSFAQSEAPAAGNKGMAVSYDPTTGLQLTPAPYARLFGYTTNILAESYPRSNGTNFVINPRDPETLYVIPTNRVRFLYATNVSATTTWKKSILFTPVLDQTFDAPATWFWETNSAQLKITTLASNVNTVIHLKAYGTNIHIYGTVGKKP